MEEISILASSPFSATTTTASITPTAASIRQPRPNLYVNPGLGETALPARIGVPPEITLLTLRSAGE